MLHDAYLAHTRCDLPLLFRTMLCLCARTFQARLWWCSTQDNSQIILSKEWLTVHISLVFCDPSKKYVAKVINYCETKLLWERKWGRKHLIYIYVWLSIHWAKQGKRGKGIYCRIYAQCCHGKKAGALINRGSLKGRLERRVRTWELHKQIRVIFFHTEVNPPQWWNLKRKRNRNHQCIVSLNRLWARMGFTIYSAFDSSGKSSKHSADSYQYFSRRILLQKAWNPLNRLWARCLCLEYLHQHRMTSNQNHKHGDITSRE